MTEPELRRRAALFFRELGTADAVAHLPARPSSAEDDGARPLVDALSRFLQRHAPGERWTRWTAAFNAYAAAYRSGERHGAPGRWQPGTIMRCELCEVALATFHERVLDHVLTVSHLARAEAFAAGEKRRRAS